MSRVRIVSVASVLYVTWALLFAEGATAQTAPLEPQSLIGEWQGSWRNPSNIGDNGRYYMTIKRVENDKVYVRFEIYGRGAFQGDREGTLAGNTLTFATQFNRAVFTIEGGQMRGSTRNVASGQLIQEIDLTRTK